MDERAVAELKAAGLDVTQYVPQIGVAMEKDGKVLPVGERVLVFVNKSMVPVRLKKISELFVGDRVPPNFVDGPTPEYEDFFFLFEATVYDYWVCTGIVDTDQEIERLYNLLKRRPDGRDANPLFSYMQAAARLYMSIFDVSKAEFEAVAARLRQSARTFSEGLVSRNYIEILADLFEEEYAGVEEE